MTVAPKEARKNLTDNSQSPPNRLGPRPLAVHLALASSTWMGGAVALPAALTPSFPWHPSLTARAVKLMEKVTPDNKIELQKTLIEASALRIEEVLAGINAYRHHPYSRKIAPPKAVATFGSSRLLDYGMLKSSRKATTKTDDRPIILCIPSLINPAYILDLDEGVSLMRYLGQQGFRPLLVDWGTPGVEEKAFTLSDYVVQRLMPMAVLAAELQGGPVQLMGYCMGGNLALALAAHCPELISKMALIATPWDFHVQSITQARAISTVMSGAILALEKSDQVPVDFLQLFFTSLDPTLSDRKFRRFARLDPASDAAHLFVAIEDWSNDGAPLSSKVARECLEQWYGLNAPAKGEWQVAGKTVNPAKIKIPALVILPATDRIVPPASARALGLALPNAETLETRAGHVTMIVGPAAKTTLWQPLAEWLWKCEPFAS